MICHPESLHGPPQELCPSSIGVEEGDAGLRPTHGHDEPGEATARAEVEQAGGRAGTEMAGNSDETFGVP
jgi:hypothetical protein